MYGIVEHFGLWYLIGYAGWRVGDKNLCAIENAPLPMATGHFLCKKFFQKFFM